MSDTGWVAIASYLNGYTGDVDYRVIDDVTWLRGDLRGGPGSTVQNQGVQVAFVLPAGQPATPLEIGYRPTSWHTSVGTPNKERAHLMIAEDGSVTPGETIVGFDGISFLNT